MMQFGRRGRVGAGAVSFAFALLLAACAAQEPQAFDGQAAYAHVTAQCDLGFRPTGSEAGRATGATEVGETLTRPTRR